VNKAADDPLHLRVTKVYLHAVAVHRIVALFGLAFLLLF
jgi:hypothetical protein